MTLRGRFRGLLCWAALLVAAVVVQAAPKTRATPFKFEPLGVANPCFVDSVRFADEYLGGKRSEGKRWVRVLRWGTLDDDYSMGPGHAVAVFQWRGRLFVFDINHGVRELAVPTERREVLREVSQAVLSMYPQFRPVGAVALDDSWSTHRPQFRGGDDHKVTPAYRDAYRVAKLLGKRREVRLVRFSHLEKGKRRDSAAAVFLFARQLCIYIPERGTMVLKLMLPSVDDDDEIRRRLVRCFGREAEVRLEVPSAN